MESVLRDRRLDFVGGHVPSLQNNMDDLAVDNTNNDS